ncbi:hypothetical protein TNCV_2850891 [Trichonephila clavipes]|nr:hypothetical protein TNCV_2850891 [Trichonephila clavipes]
MSFNTDTIPDDLLLESVSNVLHDTRHLVQWSTMVLEPYTPKGKSTANPLENWIVHLSVLTRIGIPLTSLRRISG